MMKSRQYWQSRLERQESNFQFAICDVKRACPAWGLFSFNRKGISFVRFWYTLNKFEVEMEVNLFWTKCTRTSVFSANSSRKVSFGPSLCAELPDKSASVFYEFSATVFGQLLKHGKTAASRTIRRNRVSVRKIFFPYGISLWQQPKFILYSVFIHELHSAKNGSLFDEPTNFSLHQVLRYRQLLRDNGERWRWILTEDKFPELFYII